jgi:hypothetical protein
MARQRSNPWLPAILALGCAGLAGVIYHDLQAAADAGALPTLLPGQAELQRGIDPLPPEPTFAMPPLDSYVEVVARPMFSPGRRPAAIDPVLDAAPASALALELKGVVHVADRRIAMFARDGESDVTRLEIGDTYGGWELVAIEQDYVIFQRGPEETRLQLAFEAAPPQQPRAGLDPRRRRDVQPPEIAEPATPQRQQVEAADGDVPFLFEEEETPDAGFGARN